MPADRDLQKCHADEVNKARSRSKESRTAKVADAATAPAFVYFASEVDSSYVTGEVLTLLGGETTAA